MFKSHTSKIMKPTLTLSTLIVACFLISGTFQITENCSALHEGTFKYGNLTTEIIVKIKGKQHVEYHDGGKYKIESELEWINECEYNMTMKKVTIPNFPYGPGDIMHVRIEKVVGSDIYYISTVKGNSWKGKFIKIE